MNIVIIGCGFVADFYMKSLASHEELNLLGVWDHDEARLIHFSKFYAVKKYDSLTEVLLDAQVDLVVNLTNPHSHFIISKQSLDAGKHVYSEKPLALSVDECNELVDYANEKSLSIFSAPCNLFGDSFQFLRELLDKKTIGKLRVVYAEMDDGLVHKMQYKKWLSNSGTPWPYKDEFEVGCTLEHAAYYVAPLISLFGNVGYVNAFASCQIPDKLSNEKLDIIAPDFSVACIKFESGLIVRLTCSIIASHDRSLQIIGDDGVLKMDDCWNNLSAVKIQRRLNVRRRTLDLPWLRKFPSLLKSISGPKEMDFALGLSHIKASISNSAEIVKTNGFSLHVNEVVLAIHNADKQGGQINIQSSLLK